MTDRKFNDQFKEALRNIFGYNDDQIKVIEENPKQFETVEKVPFLASKKMVATCIEAQNCSANKVGDRYVFNALGSMIKNETCEKACLWAMSTFLPFFYILYDRAASGLDLSGMHFEYIECPDTGCKYGGAGKAMFKISVEDT